MPSARINYLKGLVICHGKSEVQMVRYVTTNLHLNVRQHAKDNGAHSIQITDLTNLLNSKKFKTITSFSAEYPVETKGKGSKAKLEGFKLFIIMDTDDCTEEQKQDYISKKMFEGHWLYDYIVPLFNTPNLENVLYKAGILTHKIKKCEKCDEYTKIFPLNKRPLSDDTKLEVETFKSKIQGSSNTNMTEFIDYCLYLLN